jgi:basic membrane protein A
MRIGVLFVGKLEDAGFNASGLAGALAARESGLDVVILDGIPYELAAMQAAMRRALPDLGGLVFVGGQGDAALPPVATEFPQKRFAVVQGHVCSVNVASYDVLQEQSAFLAGHLAARTTKTGTVAHLSGHRVRPGLKGRAAFVAGVRHAAPDVRVLTGFCGSQDDNGVTRRWASAEIAEGADVLFTMLNGGRQGAIDACAAAGVRQIGNVLDWCAIRPDVFLASAEARIDLCVSHAIEAMVAGRHPPAVRRFGLADGAYVTLRLAADVPASLAAEIADLKRAVAAGDVVIPADYAGPEFALEPSHA